MQSRRSDHAQYRASVRGRINSRYSVLLTTRNEGLKLRRTVDDVLHHGPVEAMEVVIIDDASDDDSTAFLAEPAYAALPIRKFRNDRPRGLIYNRAKSAELARGEYLALLDAHCAVSSGWLDRLADKLESVNGRGLVVPAVYKLRPDWTMDLASGAGTASTINSPFWEFGFTSPWTLEGHTCTCTIGGMAWMCRRDWYHHIGGLDSSMVVWGLENIDVPLRTWAAGGWCLVAEDVRVGHLYNEQPSLRMHDADYVYNKIRAVHNVFTPETFKKVMGVLIHLAGFREAITRVYQERHSLTPAKDRFESLRERSDDWIIDTFGLPVLESPAFHMAQRRPVLEERIDPVERPTVSVLVPFSRQTANLDSLLSSILLNRTYGRFDVSIAVSDDLAQDEIETRLAPWQNHPRVSVQPASKPTAMVNHLNLKRADYLALLPANAVAVGDYWIEDFLLLAERRPRMLMACPRTRWQFSDDESAEHTYEHVWDWDAPRFFRERSQHPAATEPYQVMSCPATLLFVRRDALDSLGGFDDDTIENFPTANLAIQGWLSGLEVLCHPKITVTCLRSPKQESSARDPATQEYSQVLPAVTYFTSFRRAICREKCPRAEPLLRQHTTRIEQRRREFLARARYDDDWLFFKFGVRDPQ